MKIKNVKINNNKKCISIETSSGLNLDLPFSKLEIKPSHKNTISKIFVDKELGKEAITYILSNESEASIHLDSFLHYNKDPNYLKESFLFELTIKAKDALKKSKFSKNEICRRLKTSPAQLARLLDQTNKRKSVDNMLKLLGVLGIEVTPLFKKAA